MADHILGSVTPSGTFEVAAPTLDRGGAVYNVKHPDFWNAGNHAAAFTAADGAVAAGGWVYVPRGTYVLNSSITLSRNWRFAPGAVLQPATGVTVTFSGGFEAPPTFLIDETAVGAGTVAFAESTRATQLYAEWWQSPSLTNFTIAFSKAVRAQASTRSIPIQLLARTYIGNIVIPDDLYLFPRGGFILRGMGPRVSTVQSVNAATPAIAYDATAPGAGFDTSKLHLAVTIENLGLSARFAGGSDAGSTDVLHLRGLRGTVDLPDDSVGRRVYGRLRDLLVVGISTTADVAYGSSSAILVRAPFGMEIENVFTEASDWALKLEGGSNCSVIHFNTLNNSFGGIFIEEGGSHTFVRPRIEDRNQNKGGQLTVAYYLKDSGANTFFGWGNEGKAGLDYTVFLHGTKAARPVSNNVFMGGGLAAPQTTQADTRTHFATILLKGLCFNNHFRTGVQRPGKRDTSVTPAVTTYYDAVRFETDSETVDGVTTTLTPRHNTLHLSYTDNVDAFPLVNLGPDPASNILELVEKNAGKKRVLGRDIVKTASYTLKEYEVGLTFTNSSASTITFTLPAAKTGMEYSFIAAAGAVRAAPAGTNQVRGGGAGKYVEIPAGGGATLRCVDEATGTWEIFLSRGTLTFQP